MKISIVGIRGLPNNYGGFETLVNNILEHLAKYFEITVYCSSKDIPTRYKEYKNAKLEYIPISSHGFRGILYDSIALIKSVKSFDKILILAFGTGLIIPLFKKYKTKFIVNIGGLDWQRSKWNSIERKVIKKAESNLININKTIISDNIGIKEYIKNEYNRESILIPYGGDQAKNINIVYSDIKKYPFLSTKYAITVARIQPDNNIEMLLNTFNKLNKIPLVIVGNWNNSKYGQKVKKKYLIAKNIILLNAVYDEFILDKLRSNCTFYVHGHSAGGTNPSLVEAMHLGLPIFAFASGYNEYTTFNKAKYFKDEEELSYLISNYEHLNLSQIGRDMKQLAKLHYCWADITSKYQDVFLKK